jgi:hypothetical protein
VRREATFGAREREEVNDRPIGQRRPLGCREGIPLKREPLLQRRSLARVVAEEREGARVDGEASLTVRCVVGDPVLGLARRVGDHHRGSGIAVRVEDRLVEMVHVRRRRLRDEHIAVGHEDAAKLLAALGSPV